MRHASINLGDDLCIGQRLLTQAVHESVIQACSADIALLLWLLWDMLQQADVHAKCADVQIDQRKLGA